MAPPEASRPEMQSDLLESLMHSHDIVEQAFLTIIVAI